MRDSLTESLSHRYFPRELFTSITPTTKNKANDEFALINNDQLSEQFRTSKKEINLHKLAALESSAGREDDKGRDRSESLISKASTVPSNMEEEDDDNADGDYGVDYVNSDYDDDGMDEGNDEPVM